MAYKAKWQLDDNSTISIAFHPITRKITKTMETPEAKVILEYNNDFLVGLRISNLPSLNYQHIGRTLL